MKTYFAGIPGGGWVSRERELNKYWNKRLWSYHWLIQDKKVMGKKNKKVELFLDSGAFSAWSQGKEINVQDYIDFIKENENVIDVYANLDIIGSAEDTWQNQVIMEEAGLSPIPIFHYRENEKWLKQYIEKGYDYIGLGGMVPISNGPLTAWLDHIFADYLTDNNGYPICKIHGFDLTGLKLMLRYPWYSVDSTSWVVTGRMGSIYIPRKVNGKRTYDKNSWKVAVSNRSPETKEAGKHINNFPKLIREQHLEYIHEKGYKLGESEFKEVDQNYMPKENKRWFDKKPTDKNKKRTLEIIKEDGISNRYQLRDEMNIIYFLDLEKSMPEWPWPFKRKSMKGFNL